MARNRSSYFSDLTNNKISIKPVKAIHNHMKQIMKLKDIPSFILRTGEYGPKVTEELTRLDLSIGRGNQSWEGLAIIFPGDRHDLTTKNIGTPYIRMILYPILDLYHRIKEFENRKMPCIYLVGDRFSDVLLRKFSLLKTVIPHVIILTNDLYNSSIRESHYPDTKKNSDHESWWQMQLCKKLGAAQGLKIPVKDNNKFINARLLSWEVPASEGTRNPERLDILCYDKDDHSLIAFEIKGPKCGRVEFENLFLQGLEHRNWLERNKMAVKFLFDRGPLGRRINTKKRVRLILGFCDPEIPRHFSELRRQAARQDPYLKIDFVHMSKKEDGNIELFSCD